MKPLIYSKRRKWLAVGVVLSVLLIAGLLAPLTLAAPESQAAAVLRIGYLGMRGSQTANGAQLAIDQINSIGGVTAPDGTIFQLELVTMEAEPTVDTLEQAIGTLQAQNVDVLLGPDTNALITPDNIQALVNAARPVLTPATGDALTDYDQDNFIFRTRAPERVFSYAIATYLTSDLGLTEIAVVQTEVEFTEALMHFETSLSNLGITLADKVQLPGGEALIDETQRLIDLDPQAVVMWGSPEDAAVLLGALREAGWPGVFAFRKADEAAQTKVLPDALADGVLGMDSWSYSDPLDASRIFLRDYVVAFGELPGPQAVAAYDALWYLRFAVTAAGIDPAALRAALLEGSPRTLVQGVLHPLEFGNGDLSRTGVVYELGPRGGSTVLARFDDISRLQLDQAGPDVGPTPTPTATL
ncbi:MAG: ABC transporter substrate-binding protein, partial [Chloroflexi bacterium]|nr:ABC transporter substrate-binding protein [Chloroflexota bacterium]